MHDVPKVIRCFGSLYDLFFGEGFDESKWTRISIKRDEISYVKGREIDQYLRDHTQSVITLAAAARSRHSFQRT